MDLQTIANRLHANRVLADAVDARDDDAYGALMVEEDALLHAAADMPARDRAAFALKLDLLALDPLEPAVAASASGRLVASLLADAARLLAAH